MAGLGRRFARLWLALTLSGLLAGCIASGTSKSSNPAPTITSISLSPQNSAVTVGKTLQLSAQATFSDGSTQDVTSTATWATSDTGLATVSSGGLVTGVKIGLVNVAVGSGAARASTILNVTTKSFSQSSLKGSYAFTLTGETSQRRLEGGSIKADGAGNFTGIEDINSATGVTKAVSVLGKYTIMADGRGSLTLNTAGEASRTFHFVLSANSASPGDNNGQLIEFDKAGTTAGLLLAQDLSALSNASLANHVYAFRVGGLDSTQNPISIVGQFTVDGSGVNFSRGEEDENDNGTINSGAGASSAESITAGTIGAVDPVTGRATLSLTVGSSASDFAAYVISSGKIEVVGLDAVPMVSGEAEAQVSPLPSAPTAGGYTLATEIGGMRGQYWIMGQLQVGSSGQITGVDQNQDGGLVLGIASPGGTFSLGANGRGSLLEDTGSGARSFVVYVVSAVKVYVLQIDDPHADSGLAELQQPGPDGFSTGTLNNSFVLSAADTSDGNLAMVGEVVADGTGHLTGMVDVSQPQAGNPSQLAVSTVPLTAAYSAPLAMGVASGANSSQGAGIQTFILYLDSSNKALLLGTSPIDIDGGIALQ